MLLLRYKLEQVEEQSIETRLDIISALEDGYREGYLSSQQIEMIIFFSYGYSAQEVASTFSETQERTEELLNAAMEYLSTVTRTSDSACIRLYKGTVKEQWIAQAEKLAKTW